MNQENEDCTNETENDRNKEENLTEEIEEILNITEDFVKNMFEKMLLDEIRPSPKIATEIINRVYTIFSKLPNIVEINNIKNITIVGDTHGQFHDIAAIFKDQGFPTEDNPYIFNGDFVDRGKQGIEILLTLFAFKIANPNSIFLNRGNQYVLYEIEMFL